MFNVRDLMINLAARFPAAGAEPAGGVCYLGTGCDLNGSYHCGYTCIGCTLTCPNSQGCLFSGGCVGRSGPILTMHRVLADPALARQYHDAAKQQVATLKEQLKEALAEVEKQEQILRDSEQK
jgi:hypothetical protein